MNVKSQKVHRDSTVNAGTTWLTIYVMYIVIDYNAADRELVIFSHDRSGESIV